MVGLNLLSPNYESLDFANASTNTTYSAGEMHVVGALIGVFAQNVGTVDDEAEPVNFPNANNGTFIHEAARINLPKETGSGMDMAQGLGVFYDAAEQRLTVDSTSNTKCASVRTAVGTADAFVDVVFNGAGIP